jgi:Cu(I)/Ag(I) efflux system membrane protein CusA/SilA
MICRLRWPARSSSPGVSLAYSGQFEYLARAIDRLKIVVPATLAIIFLLLYLIFRRLDEAVLIMGTLPSRSPAVSGSSTCSAITSRSRPASGSLRCRRRRRVRRRDADLSQGCPRGAGERPSHEDIAEAVREGALAQGPAQGDDRRRHYRGAFADPRRPGAGSEVMSRIAAPMVGGMLTAPLLSMFVIPAAYLLLRQRSSQPSIPMKHHERNLQ